MEFLDALAQTFSVTRFDAGLALMILLLAVIAYYFLSLHQVFEAAFGAMVGLGIYVLLSVLLLGNVPMGSAGGLFPFGFAVFVVSIAIYLVYILAVLFPMHGGLVIAANTSDDIYTPVFFYGDILLRLHVRDDDLYGRSDLHIPSGYDICLGARLFVLYRVSTEVGIL